MLKVYIWGAGHYMEYVASIINKEICTVEGLIDSDKNKQGFLWKDMFKVYSPMQLLELEYDFIVISVQNYQVIENLCKELKISEKKIISYWKDSDSNGIFENRAYQCLKERKEKLIYKNRLDSAPYEWGLKPVPQIHSANDLLHKIIKDKSSMSRFGDGEFNIMSGRGQPWFQNTSESLKDRLIEVIHADIPMLNIAIAQNFIHLEKYTEDAADEIRAYMSNGTREDIIKFIDFNHIYYDAYVTRPYLIYKNHDNAEQIFPLFKEIWKSRPVILVEGIYARTGIRNDLFHGCKNIKRIICPAKNAWDCYDLIKKNVLQAIDDECLVCISLGPMATVLAYDLTLEGIQALDIGQIDNEYDWYLMGAVHRTAIPGKMVAEIADYTVNEVADSEEFRSQIIAEIC